MQPNRTILREHGTIEPFEESHAGSAGLFFQKRFGLSAGHG
jgi:hypothetical protein